MVGSLRKELEAAKKAAAVGNATQKDVQNREKELKEKEEQLKEKGTEIASLQKKLAERDPARLNRLRRYGWEGGRSQE